MAAREPETPDAARFAAWVRAHGRVVHGFVLALVRRGDVADDLTQEVFTRAWQARDRYWEQGQARAYLLRIADRLVCDRGRRGGRETTVDADAWDTLALVSRAPDPQRELLRVEAAQQLAAALDQLSVAQRRVLLLRYYGQMGFKEIAATVDCPLGTALSHARRGLETLRQLLVEEEETQ